MAEEETILDQRYKQALPPLAYTPWATRCKAELPSGENDKGFAIWEGALSDQIPADLGQDSSMALQIMMGPWGDLVWNTTILRHLISITHNLPYFALDKPLRGIRPTPSF
jgi:hypothetical protein